MKILLVNNHTVHLDALKKALVGHEIEVLEYRPGVNFNDVDKDLVVLSGGGGEGLEITDKIGRNRLWYEDEMAYVRDTNKPVLGICMGFEVIVNAYGGEVRYRPELTYGFRTLHATKDGQSVLKHKVVNQMEAHYWYVQNLPKPLKPLIRSDSGYEAVMHEEKCQLGTQFHPEVDGGNLKLAELAKLLVAA